tara:strand:+ start:163 stop:429 length:267 start_codon:yes stop_codon:yes gene_type:complete
MSITYEPQMDAPPILVTAIESANSEQLDTLWSILKYKEIGIFRKIKCMTHVLGIDFSQLVDNLPKDDEGRVLDYKTRHMIHDILIKVS